MAPERIPRVEGPAIPLRGDNIDTDRIIPARFLRSVSFEGLEEHLFEDDRAQAGGLHPFGDPSYDNARVLLVNANFGCGSSREHAPQALRRRGIRAIVGESFSEIFFGNSVALGLPCVVVDGADASRLQAEAEQAPSIVAVDLERMTVRAGALCVPARMPDAARDAFLDGSWDATGLLLERYDEVRAVAQRLPYVSGWNR